MVYKTDYHIHTTFSDGRSSPEDYITAAQEAEIREIGFSEHLSLFKENQHWCLDPGRVQVYLDYIDNLIKDTRNIIIRKALEIDYIPQREKETEEFLSRFNLDYRIGSVHYLGEKTVDSGPEFYDGKNIDLLYESYFDHVIGAVDSGLFDIIGHCDLIRIHGFKPACNPEHLYRKLAKALRRNDIAFELNTNGRNRPLADFYPDRRFLSIFKEENVPVCVNSDAHLSGRLGQYFDEAYELLRYTGFSEMAVFEGRKRKMVPF